MAKQMLYYVNDANIVIYGLTSKLQTTVDSLLSLKYCKLVSYRGYQHNVYESDVIVKVGCFGSGKQH